MARPAAMRRNGFYRVLIKDERGKLSTVRELAANDHRLTWAKASAEAHPERVSVAWVAGEGEDVGHIGKGQGR